MRIATWIITVLLFFSFLLTGYFIRFHFLNRRQEKNKDLEAQFEILNQIRNKEVKEEENISEKDKAWAQDLYEIKDNERELSKMAEEVKESIVYTREE
ncbi:hypothetical protein A6V39_03580 [Candidatus Mycoplasma haematobovis]|uniref:Uncharacterized protein n=1 Tax=Candidatus Mycoplasma haematobovis TaxID=432608 RepID=A0A1A9QBX8_9MOLU|nr:hypothetical protein [Candidatus Mycoplasma haematobovis]OAL09967.1 hypothetical protein A6V39_03580 [Candidatus Mycoplasma haematobovis]